MEELLIGTVPDEVVCTGNVSHVGFSSVVVKWCLGGVLYTEEGARGLRFFLFLLFFVFFWFEVLDISFLNGVSVV